MFAPCFRFSLVLAIVTLIHCPSASAVEIEGFTEPFRTVKVAAEEMGVLSSVTVREGQSVTQGQKLACLSDDVLKAQLEVVKQELKATGKLRSATAELDLRTARLNKLLPLRAKGFARQEEVVRAQADREIALARLESVKEQMPVKQLEIKKIQVQMARRVIRASMDGVITVVKKRQGEFVAPNDPVILEVVQLKTIFAKFSVASSEALKLSVGHATTVQLGLQRTQAKGTIHFISPVTDAESGTVRVKIKIDNSAGKYRSGETCTWQLP